MFARRQREKTRQITVSLLVGSLLATFQSAIAEGQLFPGGQLASVQQRRMVRAFPVWLSLPEDAPPDQRKLGLAARVTIMTERAQVVAIVATFMHWFKTSLDIVL